MDRQTAQIIFPVCASRMRHMMVLLMAKMCTLSSWLLTTVFILAITSNNNLMIKK